MKDITRYYNFIKDIFLCNEDKFEEKKVIITQSILLSLSVPYFKLCNYKLKGLNLFDYLGIDCFYNGNCVVRKLYAPERYKNLTEECLLLKINDIDILDETRIVDSIQEKGRAVLLALNSERCTSFTESILLPEINIVKSESRVFFDDENNVVLKVKSFSNLIFEKDDYILDILKNNNNKKMVLDLRSNNGGLLKFAINFCSYFITESNILGYVDDGVSVKMLKKDDSLSILKFVEYEVLIDEDTCSCAEIVCMFFKESLRAVVRGQKSYGKGMICRNSKLTDTHYITYPFAEFISKNSVKINCVGICPDCLD